MWAEISPKERDLPGLGNLIVSLTDLMGIGKHLSLASRKCAVSSWLHQILIFNLTLTEGKPTVQTKGIVFWAWTNQSMAVGPTVIWSLHATWCCWCVCDAFWIRQVHHHISSMNGLLELSLGQASLYGLALGFVVFYDLVVDASVSSRTRRWSGRGYSLFSDLCDKYLGMYVWCVYSFDENVLSPERQTFVMLVLLAQHSNIS